MGVDSKGDHRQKWAWRYHLWFLVSVPERREDHTSMPLKPRALETRASSLNRECHVHGQGQYRCLRVMLG